MLNFLRVDAIEEEVKTKIEECGGLDKVWFLYDKNTVVVSLA